MGNATANTTGMAGRDEIEDMLLIGHNNGLLSDIQLLCLVNELKRNDVAQSNFPYELYPPFNWDNYDENTCQNEMRFEKADILRLKRCLQIPLFKFQEIGISRSLLRHGPKIWTICVRPL